MISTHPLPWIACLPKSCRDRFRELGRVEVVDRGKKIIALESAETHLFLVEAGELHLHHEDGSHTPVGTGELVGETAFLDNAPHRADVVATHPARLRRIERIELITEFAAEPTMLQAILTAISDLRTRRLYPVSNLKESAADFVARLAEESLRHRAVRHPFLRALADGSLPDTRWALADFARQYHGYSCHFPRYLTTVISRLESPAHRNPPTTSNVVRPV